MKLLSEVKVRVGYDEKDIFFAIRKKFNIERSDIASFEIVRESLDARKKPNILMSLNIAVVPAKFAEKKFFKFAEIVVDHSGLNYSKINFSGNRPVVVGFGPSGMFAGLALAISGLKPIIVEQGKCVNERQQDIDLFWKTKKLNCFSNVQFGEGGAGTFSDGKLTSNVNNDYTKKVINEFILCGAPPEIFYSGTPHIGSDKLKEIVTNVRKKIIGLGGEVWFNTKFLDYEKINDKTIGVKLKNVITNKCETVVSSALVLAVGHSAEDVYRLLNNKGLNLVPKPFAMGVRIEGLQSEINASQYGQDKEGFPPANYKLVTHLTSGRSVFTFCMCPGGEVVASASEPETIVTNGMSNYKRDGKNANSAVLVNVVPSDFESLDPLSGVEFQRKYEKLAFILGGSDYRAPAEKVKDFLSKTENPSEDFGVVKPTYSSGVKLTNLKKCLPDFVYESLIEALPILNNKLNNFAADDNLLIGIESRSSAPVQVVRSETFMADDLVFVTGEGAGYAGGITSSAADGIRCAENVISFICENI